MDPITTAIVAAIASGVTKAGIESAYEGLKAVIRLKWGETAPIIRAIVELEADPSSKARVAVLAEKVNAVKANDDPEVKWALAHLIQEMKARGIGGGAVAGIHITRGIAQGIFGVEGDVNVRSFNVGTFPKSVLASVIVLFALAAGIFWMTRGVSHEVQGVKKETSADARKELHNIGIPWTQQNFFRAVQERDYRAIELFLKSGMRPDMSYGPDYSFIEIFVNQIMFDSKVADLMLQYNTIDPAKACPPYPYPYGHDNDFHFYTRDAQSNPSATKFVRAICAKPDVIARINNQITESHKTLAGTAEIDGWQEAKSLLAGAIQ